MKHALHIAAAKYSNNARIQSYIRRLLDNNWHVDVICYSEKEEQKYPNNENIFIYGVSRRYQGKRVLRYFLAYFIFFLKAGMLAVRLHRKKHYDFVHVHNMPNFLVGVSLFLNPKPTEILDMHDIMILNYQSKFGSGFLERRLLELEEKWSIENSDHLICADYGQKKWLKKKSYYHEPIVVMNTALPSLFEWMPFGNDLPIFRFVYHGTLAYRLGVDQVLFALKELPESIRFRIIGEGDQTNFLKKLILELNLSDRVELIPSVRHERLPALLMDCNCGIIPSRCSEATNKAMLPVKLLEYSACGIPCVVAKLENITLHFSEDQLLYYDPESIEGMIQAMKHIISSEELRREIRSNLVAFNQKYNWKLDTEKYLSLIGEICVRKH